MRKLQRTIENEVSFSGVGLHTGNETTITFKSAPANTGIKFIRKDCDNSPEIPALIENVVDISRGTTLGKNGVKVHTVEHVLAAITGLEIDNILVELSANEPPVGDGSALPFVETLLKAGFVDQDSYRNYLVIDETVSYKDEESGVEIVALPTDDFRVTIMIDYNNPTLGSQHTGLFSLQEEFLKEFAPARTFCFLTEVEQLSDEGLIKGGNLDSAIVVVDKEVEPDELERLRDKFLVNQGVKIGDNGIINGVKLRYKNELCRHKLLDLLGDLALVGVPIKAQILAARTGHKANIEFVKKIRKLYEKKKFTKRYQAEEKAGIVFDISAIEKILPHRYPFLLVDKIISFDMDKHIVGIKNVTRNEPFFNGHFPGQPIMPGVLIVEAMAQVGGILLLNVGDNPEGKLVLFMGIDKVRFRKPVIPGDQIKFELEMKKRRGPVCMMSGKAYVEGSLVCEAELMATIVDKTESS